VELWYLRDLDCPASRPYHGALGSGEQTYSDLDGVVGMEPLTIISYMGIEISDRWRFENLGKRYDIRRKFLWI
jgi:hypothetical protein